MSSWERTKTPGPRINVGPLIFPSMNLPPTHPRYQSLRIREDIEKGLENGLVAPAGLLAHGRGEAFDYLIEERTHPFAVSAMEAGVATLLLASRPVISLNGNTVALAGPEMVSLANEVGAKLEVNLFYRSEERIIKLVEHTKSLGAEVVLGENPDAKIPGLDHERGKCTNEGIFSADVVFVPLEDGDRTQALKKMGKKVITIDLNPMSRTAVTADITIVDNLVRSAPYMAGIGALFRTRESDGLTYIVKRYDNRKTLSKAYSLMIKRLETLGRCIE